MMYILKCAKCSFEIPFRPPYHYPTKCPVCGSKLELEYVPNIEVYFDGLCEPRNPHGVATYGFVIYDNRSAKERVRLHEGYGVVGAGCLGDDVSNNVAEYTALMKALEWLVQNNLTEKLVEVKGDSQLAIRQLNGIYRVKAPRIIPLYKRVVELAEKFNKIHFIWVPRQYNEEADSLSRKAYHEFCNEHRDLVMEYYGRYFITEKQKRYILFLARRKGVEIEVNDFMSKREASKLIEKLLSSI